MGKVLASRRRGLGRVPALPALGLALAVLAAVALGLAGPQQKPPAAQSPGPLSLGHGEKPGDANCTSCHALDGRADGSKCLTCHAEIAREAAVKRGFHRDKGGDCAVCHQEHQGRDKDLTGLDPKRFDHAETGAELRGVHRNVKDCSLCHRPEISFPRAKTYSYILKDSGCRACHASPHPGREDNCLACHTQDTWTVERDDKEDQP